MSQTNQKGYEVAANWLAGPGDSTRPGRDAKTFTEPDGMNSPEEDFANNVEYLLFDPQKLKTLTPSLLGWLRSFLGDKFVLGGRCELPAPNGQKHG